MLVSVGVFLAQRFASIAFAIPQKVRDLARCAIRGANRQVALLCRLSFQGGQPVNRQVASGATLAVSPAPCTQHARR
jgi:hypothetical protein